LLEPNAFFGDLFIFLLAIFLAFKLIKINSQSQFSKNWLRFYFVLGMGFSLGYFAFIYEKRIHPAFRLFWISTFILMPSAIFQAFKINIHPWFDRNDFSHFLLIISIILYFH